MSTIKVNSIESATGGGVDAKIASVNSGSIGNRNLVINGAMKFAQRGTSATGKTGSGIYATWYELEEESKSEFLDWMHNSYIPQELTRPGYLWAAHYELGYVGEAVQKVVDTLIYDKGSALGLSLIHI